MPDFLQSCFFKYYQVLLTLASFLTIPVPEVTDGAVRRFSCKKWHKSRPCIQRPQKNYSANLKIIFKWVKNTVWQKVILEDVGPERFKNAVSWQKSYWQENNLANLIFEPEKVLFYLFCWPRFCKESPFLRLKTQTNRQNIFFTLKRPKINLCKYHI